jgi:hypothetical protein
VIAARMGLGLTRNAIIGKLSRLPDHLRPIFAPRAPALRARVIPAVFVVPAEPVELPAPVREPDPEPEAVLVKPETEGATLKDISPFGCRWICDDPLPGMMEHALMCAADKRPGSSFCAYHHSLAFLPFTRSAVGKRRFQLSPMSSARAQTAAQA